MSWNIGSLQLRLPELLGISFSIACLQETGATARQQKFVTRQLDTHDLIAVWGTPTPQAWNRAKRLRSQTGAVPGVALIAQKTLGLRYRSPNTLQGKQLEKRGRLVLGSYPTPVTQVLVVNTYLPSGGSQVTVKDRLACLDELQVEIASYGQAPMVVIGDWNLDPTENPLVPLLLQKGWRLPVMSGPDPRVAPYTYKGTIANTAIDYGLCSQSLALVSQNVTPSLAQHQHVWLALPQAKEYVHVPEVPRAVEYGEPTMRHTHDWSDTLSLMSSSCTHASIDVKWDAWQDQFHSLCSALVEKPPRVRPGKFAQHLAAKRSSAVRLTDEGGETQKALMCFRTARRIQDFAINGSEMLLRKILTAQLPIDGLYTSEEALRSDPRAESLRIRDATRSYMQTVVKRRITCWKRTLTDQAQNPTSALYRWLKNEGPAGPIVLSSEGSPCTSMFEVFDTHRRFWEGVCAHPDPPSESQNLHQTVFSLRANEFERITGDQVTAAIKSMNLKSVAGLDCWKPSTLKMLDRQGAHALAELFNQIIETGKWPKEMTRAKVSLLHKPGTQPDRVSSWRPITVTSCFYRLFARLCLNQSLHAVLPYLPEEMLGGLPGKTTPAALLKVYLWVERIIRTGEGRLFGISLDASKCFDRISVLDALRAGAACKFPSHLLAAIGSFYQVHERFTCIRQMLDTKSWSISRGIIQGCSVSVILTCCVLKTWHDLSLPGVLSLSFIDDRLLLSEDSEALSQNWTSSCRWDVTHL